MNRLVLFASLCAVSLSSACTQKISDEKLQSVDRVAIVFFTSSRYPEMGGLRITEENIEALISGWPGDIHQDAMEAFVETLTRKGRFKWVPVSTVKSDPVYVDSLPIPDTGNLGKLAILPGLTRQGPMLAGGYKALAKSLKADLLLTFTSQVSLSNLGAAGNLTLGKSEAIATINMRVQGYDTSGSCIWNEGDFTGATPTFPTTNRGFPQQDAYRDAINEGFRSVASKIRGRMEGGAVAGKPEKKAVKKKKKPVEDDDEG